MTWNVPLQLENKLADAAAQAGGGSVHRLEAPAVAAVNAFIHDPSRGERYVAANDATMTALGPRPVGVGIPALNRDR